MKAGSARRATIAMTCAAFAAAGTGCGSKSSVATGSGKGRPAVTVGYRDTPEQAVVGELYAQSLREKGYSVKVKPNLSSAKAIDSALRSGQIDVYPEYVGVITQIVGGRSTRFKSATSAYRSAKAFEERRGLTLLVASKYSKNTILISTTAAIRKRGITGIRGLRKKLNNNFTLGGLADLRTRYDGLVGLRRAYGVVPRFQPMAASQIYRALDQGKISVAAVPASDPQMLGGKYRALADKLKVFGFQNVAPVVKTKTLGREGPAFAKALNAVTERLGRRAVRRLNSQVQIHHKAPAQAARDFFATITNKAKTKLAKKTKTKTTTTKTTTTPKTKTTTTTKTQK